jgi:hypothetical protein
VHYEAAFEDFLRARGWPYVAVDETKKVIFADASLKSFDFLVYSNSGPNLLVDVKGRKFPDLRRTGRKRGPRAFENWITRDDVEGLCQWQRVFGEGFRAALVFAYWVQGGFGVAPFEDLHCFRKRSYAYMGVWLDDYRSRARPRSQRWKTLSMPKSQFTQCAQDFANLL